MHSPFEWTVRLRPATGCRSRVVVFPHAGAGPRTYARLLSGLPEDVELIGVTLPGREHRADLPPGGALCEVVEGTGRELAALPVLPTVYWGHSMGSLLAVTVAGTRDCSVDALVLSAALPGADAVDFAVPLDTPEGLSLMFDRHRLPLTALDADSGRPRADFVLAHDLVLARSALLEVGGVRLGLPLSVFAGAHDPLVPMSTLPKWRDFTTGPFRTEVFEGAHFFPFLPGNGRALLAEITGLLTAAAETRSTTSGASR
uniref:Putative thioesterase SimC3 n=1 Tax=Streptomyces antibioticus TaxID=1890 RepID=Q9AMI2_STRAT|nr:putative thioesterase SimC3 [Streptomyces antibioticus]AAL15591.1 Sim13 [Streptomyces antibioticus]